MTHTVQEHFADAQGDTQYYAPVEVRCLCPGQLALTWGGDTVAGADRRHVHEQPRGVRAFSTAAGFVADEFVSAGYRNASYMFRAVSEGGCCSGLFS